MDETIHENIEHHFILNRQQSSEKKKVDESFLTLEHDTSKTGLNEKKNVNHSDTTTENCVGTNMNVSEVGEIVDTVVGDNIDLNISVDLNDFETLLPDVVSDPLINNTHELVVLETKNDETEHQLLEQKLDSNGKSSLVEKISTETDLMQQIELLRIVLQTVCCEIAAANVDDGKGPLLLPLWMDVLSAQELQLRLKTTINKLTVEYRPALTSSPSALASEWVELSVEEADSATSSPFGLESPVIAHMLSAWTSDENKILFLKSWIRSLQVPLTAGYPLGIQIANMSRVVRDGFVVLLVPIIRQLSVVDSVRVLIRQHQISPRKLKKTRRTSADSDDDAMLSRGEDSRVIDFSDSDCEEGEEADPFVSLEHGTVFDIRIRRLAPLSTSAEGVSSSHSFQHNHAPHHHHTRLTQVSRDGADHYSVDSHFPELLNSHHKSATAAAMSFRTDSHDYSSLSEISSVFDDMDRVVAKEVAAVHPVQPHVEEPYNENKLITAAAQLTTINSFFSSWFKGVAVDATDSATDIGALNQTSGKHDPSISASSRSESNDRVAADIIAASLAVNCSSAVSEATKSTVAGRTGTAVNKNHNNNKMAARLEAMRNKQ